MPPRHVIYLRKLCRHSGRTRPPDGDATGAGLSADQPVLQVAAVGQLDVGEPDVEPLVFVRWLLTVHGPAPARHLLPAEIARWSIYCPGCQINAGYFPWFPDPLTWQVLTILPSCC
jgi:hypothetical protein